MSQEFSIKQGSTLPFLVMELNKKKGFRYADFYNALKTAVITFSMVDVETNVLKISQKKAHIILKDNNQADLIKKCEIEKEHCLIDDDSCVDCEEQYQSCLLSTEHVKEYFIYFQFSERDTNKVGRYLGEFKIEFAKDSGFSGTLIQPLGEELYINVTKSLFPVNIKGLK